VEHPPELEEEILTALRRITRAIDLHSRHLANTYGLTGPQLVCLRAVGKHGPLSPSDIAKHVVLSQATVTGIVDRLVSRQLVTRERSTVDRRLVSIAITDAGRALLYAAPSALQEKLASRLAKLSPEEQTIIQLTLNKIVRMMDGEDIAAEPVLSPDAAAPVEIAAPGNTPDVAEPTDAPQAAGATDGDTAGDSRAAPQPPREPSAE